MTTLGQQIVSNTTAPTPGDGVVRRYAWTAPQDLTIRRLETWLGSSAADAVGEFPPVDMYATVRLGDQVLSFFGLDHYARFAGSHQLDKYFPPELAVPVFNGQLVEVEHYCQAVGGRPALAAMQVILTYTTP